MATAIRGYKNRMIMKKEYIKPEILVEELISEIYMQTTSDDDELDQTPGEGIPLSNERRRNWGDLWNEGEE